MTDQPRDTRDQAAEPRFARPPRGRHAGPRTSALTRLRLPVGRALALTALPTALILGSQRLPAADTSAIAAHSTPEVDEAGGVDCDRPEDTPAPATEVPASPTPSADPSTSGAHSGADSGGGSDKPSEHAADQSPSLSPAPTATPTPAPTPSAGATSAPTGLAGILAPLGLLDDEAEQQSPAPQASPSPSSVTPTPEATAPSDPLLPTTPAPPAGHRAAEPSLPPESTPGTARGTARACDISDREAPEETRAGRFSAEPWKLKGSRLELHDLVFHGVVTVDTAAGPKRVLKFSAAAVEIRDLKMAVPVGPQIQHIDGAPGSTSTLRGGAVTMYVESLTGTLAGVQGLPTPPVLRLNLTPDTVPEWLYDTIGNLGLKLQLSLVDADIDQAGQTGGQLVIPGIHGYGTPR
ncbi:hypothetical protein OG426_40690 [Streptomyces canus]|uniref:hypothetical protein n=1 Tax=Streptomyces canus TaxID=58343 RepID=UPI00224F3946|nr:hypothetical protein [Streptomyces canus]MCX4856195.1 hypothetical protein [Streptomyces canus]WSW38331.1 hypothetical protein OG426_40690 [Streptomyces canus]